MGIFELLMIAVGLSMDAFATSICKGLSTRKAGWKEMLICGLWFGLFQALMPMAGYFLGSGFQALIESFDHWIAFGLLLIIGANMIREALTGEEEDHDSSYSFKSMFVLAIATSIDALAVGVSFAMLNVEIFSSSAIIGVTTFLLSGLGVKIGSLFGAKFKKPSEILGGAILIFIGFKILFEHLGILG